MPLMTGFELIDIIGKEDIDIPIIVMTGENFDRNKYVEYMNEKVTTYIEKPLKENLISTIKNTIIDHEEYKQWQKQQS